MLRQPSESSRRHHVTNLVVGGDLSAQAIEAVVAAGLAGYALDTLQRARPSDENATALRDDPRLTQGRLLMAARHATVRRAVEGLLAGWAERGIEALLFKGFYLAEFVYHDSSLRKYSDVDVALRSIRDASQAELAADAAQVARQLGWTVTWHYGEDPSAGGYHDADYDGHELLQMVHEGIGLSLDAHRRLVHKNVNLSRRQDAGVAITAMVWNEARTATLGGVTVLLPDPVDATLIGLIAARSWSGDRYRLRPHDLLDLEALMAFGKFGERRLLERAHEVGLSATTRLFLRRCDPWRRHIDLRAPSPLEAFAYDMLLSAERMPRGLEQLAATIGQFPAKLATVLQELPYVARQLARRRRGEDLMLSTRPEIGGTTPLLDRRSWRRLQYAVRRSMQLLGASPVRDRELALACLYDAALRRGYAVVRQEVDERVWFEYEGRALSLLDLGDGDDDDSVPPDRPVPTASAELAGPFARVRRVGWTGLLLRLEALFQLRRVVRSLKVRSFQALHAEVASSRPDAMRSAGKQVVPSSLAGIGTAVESSARFVPEAQCVARSLAAQVMLRRRGVASTIHFGFKRSVEGTVEGHAWLESNGVVVTGDIGLDAFTRTASFDA